MDVRHTLERHPFTYDLPVPERERLAELATPRWFRAEEMLLREGEVADTFLLLAGGHAAVETFMPGRGRVVLETLGPGDVVGWSWLIEPYQVAFDVRAMEDAQALGFEAEALRAAFAADPLLGYTITRRLVGVVAQRLDATRLRLLDLYGPPEPVR